MDKKNSGWKISSKKKPRPINHFWNGFDDNNQELWYIQMEDGTLISNKHSSYFSLVKKYFPNSLKYVIKI